jgi:hypothetical protein
MSSTANLNDTNPPAPAGAVNVAWQASADYTGASGLPQRDVSANLQPFAGDAGSGGAPGAVPAPGPGDGAGGKFLKADGTWSAPPGGGGGGGSGTVTSVGLSAPLEFSVTGSPVTGAGTLAFSKVNQSAHQVYAGPSSGAAAAPTFRALVAADVPGFPNPGPINDVIPSNLVLTADQNYISTGPLIIPSGMLVDVGSPTDNESLVNLAPGGGQITALPIIHSYGNMPTQGVGLAAIAQVVNIQSLNLAVGTTLLPLAVPGFGLMIGLWRISLWFYPRMSATMWASVGVNVEGWNASSALYPICPTLSVGNNGTGLSGVALFYHDGTQNTGPYLALNTSVGGGGHLIYVLEAISQGSNLNPLLMNLVERIRDRRDDDEQSTPR